MKLRHYLPPFQSRANAATFGEREEDIGKRIVSTLGAAKENENACTFRVEWVV
jgi:hypothetical protein